MTTKAKSKGGAKKANLRSVPKAPPPPKVKYELNDLLSVEPALAYLSGLNVTALSVSYRIALFIKNIRPAITLYHEKRQEIISANAYEDGPQKGQVKEDKQAEVIEQLQAMGKEEVPVESLKLDLGRELSTKGVNVVQLAPLVFLKGLDLTTEGKQATAELTRQDVANSLGAMNTMFNRPLGNANPPLSHLLFTFKALNTANNETRDGIEELNNKLKEEEIDNDEFHKQLKALNDEIVEVAYFPVSLEEIEKTLQSGDNPQAAPGFSPGLLSHLTWWINE